WARSARTSPPSRRRRRKASCRRRRRKQTRTIARRCGIGSGLPTKKSRSLRRCEAMVSKAKKSTPSLPPYEPTKQEREAVERFFDRGARKAPAPRFKLEATGDKS